MQAVATSMEATLDLDTVLEQSWSARPALIGATAAR